VKRNGALKVADKIQMTLRNDVAEVGRVLDAMEVFGEENGLPPKKIFQFNLALDELITNIVSYGFDEGAESRIELSVALRDGIISAELTDNGKAFNPVEAALPELGEGIEDREIGGLGLRLIRTYMDRLDYQRDGGLNRLRLQMNVNAAE
jgi:anti-sigma regulatory factor (Ser/Thr protein kinase)